MDRQYTLAVIGVGRPRGSDGATGFGMAHDHVKGFLSTGRCSLTAVADISRDNAELFADAYGGPRLYEDYISMLRTEKPDIVSICTWPGVHAPMTLAAIDAGVRAVHCEKPMAPIWGEARRMHEAAVASGVQLTFNHQRRFLDPFQKARACLKEGRIGQLVQMEAECADLFDWGTHWLDMFHYFNDEIPAEWVLGQIDAREVRTIFGVPLEQQGLCCIKFANGVRATLMTGYEMNIGCAIRLIGSSGVVEIGWGQPELVLRHDGAWGPVTIPVQEGIHDHAAHGRVAADIVRCLDTGDRPLLSSYNAVRSTEIIFATYESSRRRGRIDLPLNVDGSGLQDMLAAGDIGPGEPRAA